MASLTGKHVVAASPNSLLMSLAAIEAGAEGKVIL
jgi:hypothetical protein